MKRSQNEIDNDLLQAIRESNASKVEALIAKGANVESKVQADIPIFLALERGDTVIINTILDNAKFDINIKDHGGQTLVFVFTQSFVKTQECTEAQESVIKKLVDEGASVNGVGFSSPLLQSIFARNIKLFALLVDHKADINEECIGFVPLSIAIDVRFNEAVDLLLDCGANVNPVHKSSFHTSETDSEEDNFWTPLAAAINAKNINLVKRLVSSGAEITRENVHHAKRLNTEICKLLVNNVYQKLLKEEFKKLGLAKSTPEWSYDLLDQSAEANLMGDDEA